MVLRAVDLRRFIVIVGLLASFPSLSRTEDAKDDQGEVGALCAQAALVIEGSKTYSPEEIIGALWGAEFLEASHPRAPLSAYLQLLVSTIRDGYLHGGFPDVKVMALADQARQTIHITVEEGRRVWAGPVLVKGNNRFRREAIVRALTTTDSSPKRGARKEPLWVSGEPARLDESTLKEAKLMAETASLSTLFSQVQVEPQFREDDTVVLVVTTLDDGIEPSLGSVRFEGEFTDDPEAVQRAIGLEPDMVLSRETVESFRERLNGLGRYLQVSVEPLRAPTEGRADLLIRLVQSQVAPPLGAAEPREREVLRKALRWLSTDRRWFNGFRMAGKERSEGASSLSYAVEGGSDRDGLGLKATIDDPVGSQAGAVLVLFTGDGLILQSSTLRIVSRVARFKNLRSVLSLEFRPSLPTGKARLPLVDPRKPPKKKDETWELVVGGGFTTGTPTKRGESYNEVELDVPELELAVSVILTDTTCSFRGDNLEIARDFKTVLVVDSKTGALIQLDTFTIDPATGALTGTLEENGRALTLGPFATRWRLEAEDEAQTNGYREVSVARFLVRLLSSIHDVSPSLVTPIGTVENGTDLPLSPSSWRDLADRLFEDALLAKVLREGGPAEEWVDEVLESASTWFQSLAEHQTFTCPRSYGRGDWPSFIAAVADRVTRRWDWPVDSWPATLLREAACALAGKAQHTESELKRVATSPEVGPIGYWAFAEFLALEGQNGVRKLFALRGLTECNPEGFAKEVRLLYSVLPGFGALVERVALEAQDAAREAAETFAKFAEDQDDVTVRTALASLESMGTMSVTDLPNLLLASVWNRQRRWIQSRLRELSQ